MSSYSDSRFDFILDFRFRPNGKIVPLVFNLRISPSLSPHIGKLGQPRMALCWNLRRKFCGPKYVKGLPQRNLALFPHLVVMKVLIFRGFTTNVRCKDFLSSEQLSSMLKGLRLLVMTGLVHWKSVDTPNRSQQWQTIYKKKSLAGISPNFTEFQMNFPCWGINEKVLSPKTKPLRPTSSPTIYFSLTRLSVSI